MAAQLGFVNIHLQCYDRTLHEQLGNNILGKFNDFYMKKLTFAPISHVQYIPLTLSNQLS